MTIKLTEEDVCAIYKALGFFEATLQTTLYDTIKNVGSLYLDRLEEIIDNAPIDEKQ